MTRTPRPLDLERLLRTLTECGVEFVVVGGLAVIAHGHERATTDVDICPARTQNNARALLRALRALHAEVVVGNDQTGPLPADFRALQRGETFAFATEAGDLDCTAAPDGTTGFDDLASGAILVSFRGIDVRVASLDDLIRMKRASGEKPRRGKDRHDLEVLLRIRHEQQGGLDPDSGKNAGDGD
jgi:hypothetical protein